jgi:aspartate racemase
MPRPQHLATMTDQNAVNSKAAPASGAQQRTLGLIGGLSWESTALYYQALNRGVRTRLGGQHSARLVIDSLDFAPIAAAQAAGDWDLLGAEMVASAGRLEAAGAEAILLCSNTMHKLAQAIAAAVDIPLLHIVDATAAALRRQGRRHPLLLGTRFTMEEDFYRDRLAAFGLEAAIPPPAARARLHAIIYDELVQGIVSESGRADAEAMIGHAVRAGADSVILGCTELGLLITPPRVNAPLFDSTHIHVEAALDFALPAAAMSAS